MTGAANLIVGQKAASKVRAIVRTRRRDGVESVIQVGQQHRIFPCMTDEKGSRRYRIDVDPELQVRPRVDYCVHCHRFLRCQVALPHMSTGCAGTRKVPDPRDEVDREPTAR